LGDPHLQSLDPRHVTVERIAGWLFFATVAPFLLMAAGGFVVANWPPDWRTGLLGLAVSLLLGGLMWSAHGWPALSYRHYRYRAHPGGLEIYRGVWWRSIINVPRSRIQHTDVRQGPLQRRYGVGKLVVHTAGTQHAAVELEGLSRERALALRDLLTAREDDDDAT
jgi:membrane protein YdbS with pleckstrin-like domain